MERRKGKPKVAARLPPPLVLLGLGEVAGPLSLFPPLRIPIPTRIGGGGILLPEGVGLLLARPKAGRTSPPLLLYIQGQGAPLDTIDPRDRSIAVCGAPCHHIPPRSYCSGA